jgi:hypothetical protein
MLFPLRPNYFFVDKKEGLIHFVLFFNRHYAVTILGVLLSHEYLATSVSFFVINMVSFVETSGAKAFLTALVIVQVLMLSLRFNRERFSYFRHNKVAVTNHAVDEDRAEYKYVITTTTFEDSHNEEELNGGIIKQQYDERGLQDRGQTEVLRVLQPKDAKAPTVKETKAPKETKATKAPKTKAKATKVPGSPTLAPGSPTLAPGSPTLAPGSPTLAPGSPTLAPGSPTLAPGSPTPAPASGTPAPVSDTPAPASSTPAPVSATPAPVSATPAPVSDTPAPASSTTQAAAFEAAALLGE